MTHSHRLKSKVSKCEHKKFDAQVNIIRLEDSGKFMAEVKVKCVECNTPFQFLGMPMGLSFTKPMVEVLATEARLPIQPLDSNLVEKYWEVEKEVKKLIPPKVKRGLTTK